MKNLVKQHLVFLLIFFNMPAANAQDAFEPDNSLGKSKKIIINDNAQLRNFHNDHDEDWVKFYGFQGEDYVIEAVNKGISNIVIEIYAPDGETKLEEQDALADFSDETMTFDNAPEDGVYSVKVRLKDASYYYSGKNDYELSVFLPTGTLDGTIYGTVQSAITGLPIGDVAVITDAKRADISSPEDGTFRILDHQYGGFLFRTDCADYLTFRASETLPKADAIEMTLFMIPVDLAGVVLILQASAGATPSFPLLRGSDINGDARIGLEESLYLLQRISNGQ